MQANSAAFEFEVLIVDGAVNASAYTAAEFVLKRRAPARQEREVIGSRPNFSRGAITWQDCS